MPISAGPKTLNPSGFLLLLIFATGLVFAQETSVRPLIVQPLDDARLTTLRGNTHPMAQLQFDQGAAPAALPMERMLLVLKRSATQESSLRKMLDDQQDKASPNYHKWLTPEQFGKQFGLADEDLQAVVNWLQLHGFQVTQVTKGRTAIEFSGSAEQVKEALHTSIHKYRVNGAEHWANAGDPQIPAALIPAVAGIATLHNFLKKPHVHVLDEKANGRIRAGSSPLINFSDGRHALAPADYEKIYNITPDYDYSVNAGVGVSIGVVGRSNLFNNGQDVQNFRDIFIPCCAVGNFQIVLNGPDPGDLGGGEESEATLDSSWAGAVATGASIKLVVSASTNTTDGVDLSALFIVENNSADVMTESFGSCEYDAGDAEIAFLSAVAEQAAAQGITYFVSTGDNGAEGCDRPSLSTAAGPVSVNVVASNPFTVAVGGTQFNENGHDNLYWSTSNNPNGLGSALSYIPENVWNDSCASSTCGADANLLAGSGGVSTGNIANGGSFAGFTKPSWQSGVTGIPHDGARDLPDVSLTSASHDPYVLCMEGSCIPDSQGRFFLSVVWGTSAAAPSFAGVMALVDRHALLLNPGTDATRQGQANYVLYSLAASENATRTHCNGSASTLPANTCIFNDTTVGNNSVPGESGYPNGLYGAQAGYDLATGLGSVNVANLVANWNNSTFNPTTVSLVLNNGVPVNVTHGHAVDVNISVVPNSGSGTPRGDVSLVANFGPGYGDFPLVGGTVVSSINQLAGGNYAIFARYAGDGTYAPSESTLVGVQVNPEPSTTTENLLAYDRLTGNSLPLSSVPFGSFVYLRGDVQGNSGQGFPTGTLTFTDSFGSIPGGDSFALNSQGNTAAPHGITFDTGTHILSASYSGDGSFNSSHTTQSQTVVIIPGFAASVPRARSQVLISAPGSSGSTEMDVATSTGFSTAINFSCAGLPTGSTCVFSPSTITPSGTLSQTPVSITITTTASRAMLQLHPKTNYMASWTAGTGFMFAMVWIGLPKKRRARTLPLGLMILLFIIAPGCGGGDHSTHVPPPTSGTAKGVYPIAVKATSGSTIIESAFLLIVD